MKQQDLLVLDSFTGVQGFFTAHDDVFGSINASATRQRLDQLVAVVRDNITTQLAQQRASRGTTDTRNRLEVELRKGHVVPIAEWARAKLTGLSKSQVPGEQDDFKALTPSTGRLKGARLVQVARAMGKTAERYQAGLESAHFPTDVLAQLNASADAVQAKLDQRVAAQREAVGATAAIEQALSEGRALVRALGAVVKRSARTNPQVLAEWRSAQRVKQKPGVFDRVAASASVVAGAVAGQEVAATK